MLRRVTALAALGADPAPDASAPAADFGSTRFGQGLPFTEFNRHRPGRSSAFTGLVGATWDFDPPATTQQDEDRLGPYAF